MNPDPTDWTSLVLLERYRAGDHLAAEEIFARYFDRLKALARTHLADRLARRIDPEDVVLSAYRSFFIAAGDGRYTLGRGGDLWRLLAGITKHKLLHRVRHELAERRSAARDEFLDRLAAGAVAAARPVPDWQAAVELADELELVCARLDPFARRVLELRLQGLRLVEIAADTDRAERSVRRALAAIRDLLVARGLYA